MEWYTFGLDKFFMFLFAVSSALAIVLAIMFGKDEREPKKYIEMNWSSVWEATFMKSQLVLLRRLLRTVLSADNFEELSRTIIFARKWKDWFSRSDQLILLREINNKIDGYI